MELDKKKRKVVGPFIDVPKAKDKRFLKSATAYKEDEDDGDTFGASPRRQKTDPKTIGKANMSKARLWDILSKVIQLGDYGTLITYTFEDSESGALTLKITFPGDYTSDDERDPTTEQLNVSSDDWVFDVVEKKLAKFDEERLAELAKQKKRSAILSTLTPEERELLGYKNWKAQNE